MLIPNETQNEFVSIWEESKFKLLCTNWNQKENASLKLPIVMPIYSTIECRTQPLAFRKDRT